MKRLASVLLVLCAVALAQNAPPAAAPQGRNWTTNEAVKVLAPSYSDIQCAGFVTPQKFAKTNRISAGLNAPHAIRYADRDTVFLAGAYEVGTRYSVVRNLRDPNREEIFPGQNKALQKMGNLYADLGRVRVVRLEGSVAVAQVEYSCDAMAEGDTVIPLQEKPNVVYKQRPPMERMAAYSGTGGRVIMGKDFKQFIGIGEKFYANIGSSKGLKPGDYVRITRNYDPKRMPPVDRMSLDAPGREDTQRTPMQTNAKGFSKLPYVAMGEAMVLFTTDNTATLMVISEKEDIHLGDVVEIIPQQ